MLIRHRTTAILALALGLLACHTALAAPEESVSVRDLAAVLASDVGTFEKAKACQQIAVLGGSEAVPALAALLGDPQLSAYARSALEAIPAPSAGEALLRAVAQLEGDLRIGVLNSVGVRRDAGAVPTLARFVGESDGPSAVAALSALGRIATPDATAVVVGALTRGPEALRGAAADACLASADTLLGDRQTGAALRLYERVRRSTAPQHVRLAAASREMVALGAAGVPMLERHLASGDEATRAMALRTAREMPRPEVTDALVAVLPTADPDLQALLIPALAEREGEAARDAIAAMASNSVREVRLAALRALAPIDPETIPFVPLFDGKTFDGWEGDTVGSFRIEDGAIVGGNLTTPIPRNEFLCTTGVYGDFVLRLECKVVSANGGIQFRSSRVPDSAEVSGYQADMDSSGTYWGCLYDESRRGMLVEADRAETGRVVKPNDWNRYEIRCEGPRIQLFVNDLRTVDYTEADAAIPRNGIIAVQVHAGAPSETWYRNITIAELP